jgi:hypothetical protein
MSEFKDMVQMMVASANEEMKVRELEEGVANEFNTSDYHDVVLDRLQGLESMTKNQYRFTRKLRSNNERGCKSNNECYWDYLTAQVQKMVEHSDRPKASIKMKDKKFAKASYIPSKPSASTTKFDRYNIYAPNGKDKIYNQNVSAFKVVDFKKFKKAVVLDIIPVDQKREYRSFEEAQNLKMYTSDNSFDREEVNQLVTHLVFIYDPNKDGSMNPNDGISQLVSFLTTQTFVMNQIDKSKPMKADEVLPLLVGEVINLPSARTHTFTKDCDNFYTFKVFEDYDLFAEQFLNK